MKMEAPYSSQISVSVYKNKRCDNMIIDSPTDCDLYPLVWLELIRLRRKTQMYCWQSIQKYNPAMDKDMGYGGDKANQKGST
jgi:hypothetical protein